MFSLVAFLATVYFFCFPGFFSAALLVGFLVYQQNNLLAGFLNAAPLRLLLQAAAVAPTAAGASLLASLLFYLLRKRRLVADISRWDGPGKVLLLPCRTFHSRLLPKRHSFSYSYLAVGIPVGFDGNAGGMVSVGSRGEAGPFSWPSSASRVPNSWFTVDAGDYLERGKSELGLRGKLDEYLRLQVCFLRC